MDAKNRFFQEAIFLGKRKCAASFARISISAIRVFP